MTSRKNADLFITGIGQLATPEGQEARSGADMGTIRIVSDAAVLIRKGRIEWVGPESQAPNLPPNIPILRAEGKTAVPGFVDSHTHFIFAGYRDDEFFWRADGTPYMEIHRRGGGIRKTVDATRSASLPELVGLGRERLSAMLRLGVTTVEGKSGYGLDMDTELRQLDAMRVLDDEQPVRIVPTFLGAHSVPPEYSGRPGAYMDFLLREVLPAVKDQGIARFCDVFCEKGVFDLEDSRRCLTAAQKLGLKAKIHAEEMERTGGAGLAAKIRAVSADHLLKALPEDFRAMADAGVVATCLPLTAFVLREPYADARGMIQAGCAVALASDLNPGSCYSQSIPLIFALAVLHMGLSAEEALTAITLNGAAALGLADSIGSIEVGKIADIVLLDAPNYRHLMYNSAMNLVKTVVTGGTVTYNA